MWEQSRDRVRRVTVGDMRPGTLYSEIRILYQGLVLGVKGGFLETAAI